jgi:hypothetical protein
MSNPSGPDQPDEASKEVAETGDPETGDAETAEDVAADAETDKAEDQETEPVEEAAEPDPEHEPATEILVPAAPAAEATVEQPAERRFTAPSGFDGSTQRIDTPADPATEVFSVPEAPAGAAAAAAPTEPMMAQQKVVAPQLIPPRGDTPNPPRTRRSWGWVVALLLVIAALVAVAILGTVLLTRGSEPKVSQEDMVRSTIQNFDIAIQKGDLATLRSITCGVTRDNYVNYDDRSWTETHARVAAAKQYPVVASIDQVVVNGDHAEANVTTFMAYAPQTRSTRSFDLQFRDDQWKVCQAPNG